MAASPSEIAPLFNFQEERILAGRARDREGGRERGREEIVACRVPLHLRPFSAVQISPHRERSAWRRAYVMMSSSSMLSVMMIRKAVEHDRPRPSARMDIADGLCLPNQI